MYIKKSMILSMSLLFSFGIYASMDQKKAVEQIGNILNSCPKNNNGVEQENNIHRCMSSLSNSHPTSTRPVLPPATPENQEKLNKLLQNLNPSK